ALVAMRLCMTLRSPSQATLRTVQYYTGYASPRDYHCQEVQQHVNRQAQDAATAPQRPATATSHRFMVDGTSSIKRATLTGSAPAALRPSYRRRHRYQRLTASSTLST